MDVLMYVCRSLLGSYVDAKCLFRQKVIYEKIVEQITSWFSWKHRIWSILLNYSGSAWGNVATFTAASFSPSNNYDKKWSDGFWAEFQTFWIEFCESENDRSHQTMKQHIVFTHIWCVAFDTIFYKPVCQTYFGAEGVVDSSTYKINR
jgi:hypothetical protein